MTDDEPTENSFAEFEAAATAGDEPPAKEPEAKDDEPEKQQDDEPNPEVNDQGDDPDKDEADDDGEGEKGERRSKPLKKRLGETTEKWRAEQARAAALEAELAALKSGKQPDTAAAARPDPNDDKYEFGEADPKYIEDLIEFKADEKARERAAKDAEEAEKTRREQLGRDLDAKWKEKAEKAVEKYPDFNETVIEAANAGEFPLLPLSTVAVAQSDHAADLAYHLATNPADARKLAAAEQDFHEARAAAIEAGMKPEAAMVMARPHLRRMEELFEGFEARFKGDKKPVGKIATDAPEPPRHQVRGAGGKFDVGADTTDFAAFEKKANAQAQGRR